MRGVVGADSWERLKAQPLVVSITLDSDISNAGSLDSLARSVNYSTVAKYVQDIVEQKGPHKSASTLASGLATSCIDNFGVETITIRLEAPRAVLHSSSAGVEVTRSKSQESGRSLAPIADCYFIKDLRVSTIIGIHPWEREEKQNVVVSVDAYGDAGVPADASEHHSAARFRRIEKLIFDTVGESQYLTIEALVASVAETCLEHLDIARVRVRVEKPSALAFASAAAVEIVRAKEDGGYAAPAIIEAEKGSHVAFLGLGSNLGDRLNLLQRALHMLSSRGCKVLNTSFLYETAAMYVTDQPKFLNIVCKVSLCAGGAMSPGKTVR